MTDVDWIIKLSTLMEIW